MTRYQVPMEEISINLTNISEQVYCQLRARRALEQKKNLYKPHFKISVKPGVNCMQTNKLSNNFACIMCKSYRLQLTNISIAKSTSYILNV